MFLQNTIKFFKTAATTIYFSVNILKTTFSISSLIKINLKALSSLSVFNVFGYLVNFAKKKLEINI